MVGVRRIRKKDGSNYNIYTDGLKIYTTINSHMQRYAEEAVEEHVGEYFATFVFQREERTQKGTIQ